MLFPFSRLVLVSPGPTASSKFPCRQSPELRRKSLKPTEWQILRAGEAGPVPRLCLSAPGAEFWNPGVGFFRVDPPTRDSTVSV